MGGSESLSRPEFRPPTEAVRLPLWLAAMPAAQWAQAQNCRNVPAWRYARLGMAILG